MLVVTGPIFRKIKPRNFNSKGATSGSSPNWSGINLNGDGSISGKVLENGLPVSRRVMLYERNTGVYAGQTRSGTDGNYTFKRTNKELIYFIVSIDDNNDGVQYNLVGQDLISGNHDKKVTS